MVAALLIGRRSRHWLIGVCASYLLSKGGNEDVLAEAMVVESGGDLGGESEVGTLFIASLEAGKVGDEAADTTRACGQGEPYASRTCNISCFKTLVLRCAAGSCTRPDSAK